MRPETLAVHGGRPDDPLAAAVTPPIYLSSTFERAADGSCPHGYLYSRAGNPTRAALEECLARLEGGEVAAAFSSGSAAIAAVLQALDPGDHVVVPEDVYYGTALLLRETFSRWGLEVTFVDMAEPARLREAIRSSTKLVWVESPSNPLLKITDLAAVVDLARQAGARTVCDNTFATPVLQRPLDLGVDVVVHSSSKYLGGHSDLVGGVVISRVEDDFFRRIRHLQVYAGAVPSPFDCWLLLRAIRTLPCRVRAQSESALRVAEFLSRQPGIEAVHYPGLAEHSGHGVAARQMGGFGGVLSFQVQGGAEEACVVAARVRLITRATSLGAVESTIEHRASVEPPWRSIPANLLRLSVGLEHPEDLMEDLAQALDPLTSELGPARLRISPGE